MRAATENCGEERNFVGVVETKHHLCFGMPLSRPEADEAERPLLDAAAVDDEQVCAARRLRDRAPPTALSILLFLSLSG